jgi:hypothetical protein
VAALCGGGLLAGKRLWDYFGRGRVRAHTGYPDMDFTDYVYFLAPLLLLAAFVQLWRWAGGTAQVGRANLGVASLGAALQALGEFGEAWIPHGIPWGLVGGAGLILMSVSLIWLGLGTLRRMGVQSGSLLPLLLGSLIPVQMTAIMLPYHLRGDEVPAARAGLTVAVLSGVGWVLLGYVLCTQRDPVRARQVRPR